MDRELTPEEHKEINPCSARSIEAALHLIGNPVRCCLKVYELVNKLVETVRAKCEDPKTKSKHFYHLFFATLLNQIIVHFYRRDPLSR
jgi:inositol hexakisphosphate/diphosphoinositol-pentakisphosphate kinase